MKKFKQIIAFTAAASMVMASLAGCGSKPAETEKTTTAETAAEGDDAAGEEAQPAGEGGVFKIGGIGPTTGGAAVYGQAVANAMELAAKEINAAGGMNGYQVEISFQDDEHDAEKAVNAYNTLKDWGMQMLVGTVTSTPCIAVAEKSKADNIFQLTPSGTAVECIQYENAFRVCFSDPNQGLKSAQYIGEHDLATKVAVIYNSSDVYSSGIYEKFVDESKNQGIEVVAAEAFTEDNKTDFSVQLQKAKDNGAELIFLPIYYSEASLILKQASTMGIEASFFGCDGLDGILSVENFDTTLAEGVMLLTPFAADAEDDLTTSFVTSYKAAYTDTPNQFAADAYDALYAIKLAVEKAGLTPESDASAICDAMKTAMTEITVEGLTGTITWDASGEPSKEPKAVIIEDGAYKAM